MNKSAHFFFSFGCVFCESVTKESDFSLRPHFSESTDRNTFREWMYEEIHRLKNNSPICSEKEKEHCSIISTLIFFSSQLFSTFPIGLRKKRPLDIFPSRMHGKHREICLWTVFALKIADSDERTYAVHPFRGSNGHLGHQSRCYRVPRKCWHESRAILRGNYSAKLRNFAREAYSLLGPRDSGGLWLFKPGQGLNSLRQPPTMWWMRAPHLVGTPTRATLTIRESFQSTEKGFFFYSFFRGWGKEQAREQRAQQVIS